MKNFILKILLFILYSSIGLVLAWLSERLSSNFLEKFYKSNFLALLISLTALLFAIYSLITNRLLELAKKSKYAFETTQSELKLAFIILVSDYPFMHLLYSQLLVCQRVCLQNTVCLICK